MPYIYSTLTCDNAYTNHSQGGADMPIALPPVLIKGGTGVANDRLITPRGVRTEVTDAELEYLRKNPVFLMHQKNGFVYVSDEKADAEIVAADMEGRDGSAPVVPQDLSPEEQPASVGGETAEETQITSGRRGRRGN